MSDDAIEVPLVTLFHPTTAIKVRGFRNDRMRWWIALWLVKLAAWLAGCPVTVSRAEVRRLGIDT